MSILKKATSGKTLGAQVNTILGPNGVGKSTLGCSFKKSINVDLEDGSNHINCTRIPASEVPTLKELQQVLTELIDSDFETVNIDTVDQVEALISAYVCEEGKVDSIEKYGGGYGKGYMRTRELMRELFNDYITPLKKAGKTVNLISHTQVKSISDPATNATYDKIIMRCNDKMASIIKDLSDNVLFITFKYFTEEDSRGKTRAYSEGKRVVYTQWRAGWDAKNRLGLPLEIDASYEAFISNQGAEWVDDQSTDALLKECQSMLNGLNADIQAKAKAMLDDKKNHTVKKLKDIKTRLLAYAEK